MFVFVYLPNPAQVSTYGAFGTNAGTNEVMELQKNEKKKNEYKHQK